MYIGRGKPHFVPYLELHGSSPGPLFLRSNGLPLSFAFLSQWSKDSLVTTGIG